MKKVKHEASDDTVKFALFEKAGPYSEPGVWLWHNAARNRPDHEPFIRFFELWMAFNNWAMRVTESDTDAEMIRKLVMSSALSTTFKSLMNGNKIFFDTVLRFAGYWPIFDVKDVRKNGLRYRFSHLERPEYIAQLLNEGIKHKPADAFDPKAPKWGELIQTIYQVRCNLIHGEKGDTTSDFYIVDGAFNALSSFIDLADLYQRR